MISRLAAWAVACTSALAGPGARSPEPGSGLDAVWIRWEAPASCPDAAQLRAMISGQLPTWSPLAPGPIVVQGVVSGYGPSIGASLEVMTPWGATSRRLEASTCDALVEATALVVVIALDPMLERWSAERPVRVEDEPGVNEPAALERRDPPSRDLARSEGPPAREAAEPTASSIGRPSPPARPRAATWLGAGVDAGGLPGVGASIVAGSALRWDRGHLEWMAIALPVRVDPYARLHGVLIGPRGCAALPAGRAMVPLCGGFELGVAWGRGQAIAEPRTAVRPWAAAVVHAGVRWPLARRWAIRVGVDGIMGVLRPRFVIEGRGEIHRVDPVSARGWAAVEWALPSRKKIE